MRVRFLPVIFAAVFSASVPLLAQARAYDVVIAGAGTGGVAAALQAARMGARVALVEETDWIGGQASAAAVSTMDEGFDLTPPSGLYREFLSRLEVYYQARSKSVGTCYWYDFSHCYEPSVIRKTLQQMIDEVNAGQFGAGRIDLLLRDRILRVLTRGNTVTGAVTARGLQLSSRVLIDATEYGDVLPLTPAAYRSGRSIGDDHGKSCLQDLTYVAVVKKYPHGVPAELMMQHEPPEYQKWLADLRSEWRTGGNTAPDPSTRTLPVDFGNHNAYRGLPDSANPDSYVSSQHNQITRTALNWFNDFPTRTDLFDRSQRMKILCQAKLKTLANLYYIQHELEHPDWSVANDEGYDTEYNRAENSCPEIPAEFKAIERNLPVLPYIRESRRLVGLHTLTGGEIRRDHQGAPAVTGFADSIAVGDYADDLHACDAPQDFEFELEHLTDRPPDFRSGPFEVPLRALIPEKTDGLLAAEKNISQSRLASGATRLQPITLLTGQAAGALAALAVRQGVEPRAVAPAQVQIALLKSGSIVARSPMPDLSPANRPWQAAQFAVVRGWMPNGEKGFQPADTLTRAQAASILDAAFALNPPGDPDAPSTRKQYQRASFADVPVYAAISSSVEAWRATGSLPACKSAPELFCPDAPLTTGEFLRAVAALAGKKPQADPRRLGRGLEAVPDAPLTRLNAALILFNSVD